MRTNWGGGPQGPPFSFARRWPVADVSPRGDDWPGEYVPAVTGQRRARHGQSPVMEPIISPNRPRFVWFVPIILGSYVREGMYTSCVFHPWNWAPPPLRALPVASFMRPFQLLKWAHQRRLVPCPYFDYPSISNFLSVGKIFFF